MKPAIPIAACILALSGAALADQPGSGWIAKSALVHQMEAAGYSAIVVEADDGHWEGEAVKDRRIVEFHADPHSGQITHSTAKSEPLVDRPGAGWISRDNLKKQMQAAGYGAIVAKSDDGHWEGEAVKDGRIVEFRADRHTGHVVRSRPVKD
jgi:hypothetical protein